MKIQGSKIGSIVNQYNNMKSEAKKGKSLNYGSEKIEISSGSKEVKKLTEKIKLMPKVRAEVVQKVRAEIENGNYPIDVDKIAQSILNNLVI